ncbi:MAG: TetR/AcrR family transcriptional regulator [Myxococcota bacterium]
MARPALTEDQVSAFRTRATGVALELFASDGYDRFSLRALAEALDCSHATPYRYFPGGKSEIFAEARAEGFRRFARALRISQVGAADAGQALLRMAHAYFTFSVEESAAFAIIFAMGQPEGGDLEIVNRAAADAWSVLLGCVGRSIEAGVLVGDVEVVAHTAWAGLHGVASLHAARKLAMGRSAQEVLNAMVEALFRAHRPPDPERSNG